MGNWVPSCLGLESGLDVEGSENENEILEAEEFPSREESRSSVIEGSTSEDGSELGREKMDQKPVNLLEHSSKVMVKAEGTEKVSGVKYVQRSQAPSLKEKNLTCNFCDYRIHRNDLLRVHMNSKHDVEKFKCAVASCSKVYSSKSNLSNHMKSWHICLQCDHEAFFLI